jgi:hypothetical protein
MSATVTLSRGALALLLRLLNSPSGVISGEVMHELSPGGSEELIKAGILNPSTYVSYQFGFLSHNRLASRFLQAEPYLAHARFQGGNGY